MSSTSLSTTLSTYLPTTNINYGESNERDRINYKQKFHLFKINATAGFFRLMDNGDSEITRIHENGNFEYALRHNTSTFKIYSNVIPASGRTPDLALSLDYSGNLFVKNQLKVHNNFTIGCPNNANTELKTSMHSLDFRSADDVYIRTNNDGGSGGGNFKIYSKPLVSPANPNNAYVERFSINSQGDCTIEGKCIIKGDLLLHDTLKYGNSEGEIERCFLSHRNAEMPHQPAYIKLAEFYSGNSGGSCIQIRGTVGTFHADEIAHIDVSFGARGGHKMRGIVHGEAGSVDLRLLQIENPIPHRGNRYQLWLYRPQYCVLNLELIASGQGNSRVFHDSTFTNWPADIISVVGTDLLNTHGDTIKNIDGAVTVRSLEASNDGQSDSVRSVKMGIDSSSGKPYIDFAGDVLSIRRNGTEICNFDSGGNLSTAESNYNPPIGSSSCFYDNEKGEVIIDENDTSTFLFESRSPDLIVFCQLRNVQNTTSNPDNTNFSTKVRTDYKIQNGNYNYFCDHEAFRSGKVHYIRINP